MTAEVITFDYYVIDAAFFSILTCSLFCTAENLNLRSFLKISFTHAVSKASILNFNPLVFALSLDAGSIH